MIEIRSPHTGEILGSVPERTPDDIRAAVERGRTTSSMWAEIGFRSRAQTLKKVLDALVRERGHLIDRLIAETGKVRGDALTELLILFDTFRYYLERGEKFLADKRVSPHILKNKRATVARQPRGVIGIISPWNFPIDLGFGEAIPAMLAGNVVIQKPSELTPLIALEVERICKVAGLPQGVLQVMTGGAATGKALCEMVDQITFTGSARVGRQVAKIAAERLIPCTLELGGKDPMLVLRDADIQRAAAAAVWGAFFNAGQMCMSVERVYVEAAIAETFIEEVVRRTRALRQGVDANYMVDVGSMTRMEQLEVVEAHLDDAMQRGARVLVGGKRTPGLPRSFFEPTVVVGVDHSMTLMQEETFGPVLPIMVVDDVIEGIRLANDSEYGLNASVWSRDTGAARQVARQLRSGSVCINDVVVSYGLLELPFGGEKSSGLGRRHGAVGIQKYTVVQAIAEDRFGLRNEPHWYPYSPRLFGALERITSLFAGFQRPGKRPDQPHGT